MYKDFITHVYSADFFGGLLVVVVVGCLSSVITKLKGEDRSDNVGLVVFFMSLLVCLQPFFSLFSLYCYPPGNLCVSAY